ncbi:FkbM family methyltransferase [Akkermansiaceae bacterium]|nr:FkbM family methyltransferase [Akkermansiaceae bacterium]
MKILIRGWVYSILAKIPWRLLMFFAYLKFKVVLSKTDGRFIAKDGNHQIEFIYLIRGFERYSKGLNAFYTILLENYCVDTLHFETDDVIVDIGANIGEFSLAVLSKNKDVSIIALEPSLKEYQFLVRNLQSAKARLLNLGAWKEQDSMSFFSKGDTADNSLFEFDDYTHKVNVNLDTLDSVLEESGRIKLLKIEAEGAEPEIIEGAGDILPRCDYVVIDGGPERGKSQTTTIERVINQLKKDFYIVKINLSRGTVLFKNNKVFSSNRP